MLHTKDYYQQITELHAQGLTAKQIALELGFTYHQPVYNYFKKMGWERKGKHYVPRKYNVDENFFNVINNEYKAYVLGFICADGHVDKDRISICVAIKDVDILYSIKQAMKSNHPIKEYRSKNPYSESNRPILDMCLLTINSVKLCSRLHSIGIKSNKSSSLSSEIIKYIPKYLIRDFLRGYFDGDGNVMFGKRYNSGYKYNINICGTEDFLLGSFQRYFPTINKLYKDLYSKNCYVWKVSSRDKVLKFLDFIYFNSSIHLKRKYLEYRKAMWSCKIGLIAGNSHSITTNGRTISSQSIG